LPKPDIVLQPARLAANSGAAMRAMSNLRTIESPVQAMVPDSSARAAMPCGHRRLGHVRFRRGAGAGRRGSFRMMAGASIQQSSCSDQPVATARNTAHDPSRNNCECKIRDDTRQAVRREFGR
jgi:hypothetical protein